MLSIEKYRKVLNDYETPDEKVRERLEFLDALFRNVIRLIKENYERERNLVSKTSEETKRGETEVP